MFKFLKSDKNNNEDKFLLKIASLLIHAAKIDENYTDKEEKIIKKTLIKLGAEEPGIDKLITEAKINEEKSIQILDFTKEIKKADNVVKIKIVEALWSIIYSNNDADMYETNLMRRLSGLLYLDNKTMGDIKKKVERENSK